MKRILLFLLIFVSARIYSQIADGAISLSFEVDYQPISLEVESLVFPTALNGSFDILYGNESFAFGFRLSDDYFSMKADQSTRMSGGAWNLIRGSVLLDLGLVESLDLSVGIGASWYCSAFELFSSDTLTNNVFLPAIILDAQYFFLEDMFDVSIKNKLDFFVGDSILMPIYGVDLRLNWNFLKNFFGVYAEIGFQSGSHVITLVNEAYSFLTWDVGVRCLVQFETSEKLVILTGVDAINAFKKAKKGDFVNFADIRFEADTAVLKDESYAVLESIAKIMLERPSLVVEIRGHTNDTNDPSTEVPLSLARAEAVKKFLVAKGIDSKRLKTAGFGAQYAKNMDLTDENRRVEFKIVDGY